MFSLTTEPGIGSRDDDSISSYRAGKVLADDPAICGGVARAMIAECKPDPCFTINSSGVTFITGLSDHFVLADGPS